MQDIRGDKGKPESRGDICTRSRSLLVLASLLSAGCFIALFCLYIQLQWKVDTLQNHIYNLQADYDGIASKPSNTGINQRRAKRSTPGFHNRWLDCLNNCNQELSRDMNGGGQQATTAEGNGDNPSSQNMNNPPTTNGQANNMDVTGNEETPDGGSQAGHNDISSDQTNPGSSEAEGNADGNTVNTNNPNSGPRTASGASARQNIVSGNNGCGCGNGNGNCNCNRNGGGNNGNNNSGNGNNGNGNGNSFNSFVSNGNSASNIGEGSLYTRWGRTSCPGSSRVIYRGYIGGPSPSGGLSSLLCMPSEPPSGFQTTFDHAVGKSGSTWVVTAKFHRTADPTSTLQGVIGCAVCHSPNANRMEVPGWNACPAGWTMEYRGTLMTAAIGESRAVGHICMDDSPVVTSARATNESLGLSPVRFKECPNSLACQGYRSNTEMPCTVCTRE